MGSVVSQLEKILCQRVSGILDTKGIVTRRNHRVLGASLTSVGFWGVGDASVSNSIGEDVIVTLNSHNESTELQILKWG